jgi:hypothetical protein
VDLQVVEIVETFGTGETGICTCCMVKQTHGSNASIYGTHLMAKALHITTCRGITNFSVSKGWIDRFKRSHNIVYRTLLGESRSVDPATAENWKNY